MITLGLIGAGQWGQNYLKLADKLNVKMLVGDRLSWHELVNSKKCQGIIIATPPDTHVEIALEALSNNLPVMIEKPLALNIQEAAKLKEYDGKLPILINHLHLFAPAYEYICKAVQPMNIAHIRSVGCNKGPYRNYSSLFDYGPHDIAMGMHLFKTNDDPIIDFVIETSPDGVGNQFEINLKYFQTISHHITIGNAGPQKTRFFEVQTNLGNCFVYNDLSEYKLTCNNAAIKINTLTPLENAVSCFIKSIDGYTDDRFGLDISLKTIKILDYCQKIFAANNCS